MKIECECGRQQTVVPANMEGGITELEAQSIGWEVNEEGWHCPFCTGKTEKLREIFAGRPSRPRSIEERAAKVAGYCRWLRAHGLDEKQKPRTGMNALIACWWVINCLGGLFDDEDDFDKPYQITGCDCRACEAERKRCQSDLHHPDQTVSETMVMIWCDDKLETIRACLKHGKGLDDAAVEDVIRRAAEACREREPRG
jgi:hypothetical protein